MRKLTIALSLLLIVGCKKHEAPATTATTATTSTTATTTTAATTTSTPQHAGENLVALASGAIPVQLAEATESNGAAYFMFDEDTQSGWTSADGKFSGPTVMELADRGVIHSLQFDLEHVEWEGRLPKEMLVEMSDTSATDGFKPIADINFPEQQKDGLTFPVSAEVPGRWVRFTVKSAKSSLCQIMEIHAFGDRLGQSAAANITGTYTMDDTTVFHLKQDGTTVTGCYDHGAAPLIGGIEGRLVKFTYDIGESGAGPAIFIISNEGRLFGGWWRTNGASEHPKMDPFMGKKTSNEAGSCPQWSAPEQTMASEIKKRGRVRLYGINFDSDSDVIRSESKPTLDQVVAMLKSANDLKITIEGHTDSTSTPEHNQDLSTRRANAVKTYLTGAGIDASRLDAAGLGSTKPVATNDTSLGRAENRRVELVKR